MPREHGRPREASAANYGMNSADRSRICAPTLAVACGDITTLNVDAIVNAANTRMRGGGGVDGAIHRAGGASILEDCIARFPDGLATGDAGYTTAGNLPARWVIHTVGPNFNTGQTDSAMLISCYRRAMAVADELGARTVAFPLISAGIYGWPKQDAIRAAIQTLTLTTTNVEKVILVGFDESTAAEMNRCLVLATPYRVLQGVLVLHQRGYHQARVLPGLSPSGVHWRILIAPSSPDSESDSGVEFDAEPSVVYSTAADHAFEGWLVDATTDPGTVADLILKALPGLTATDEDPAYVSWFVGLMQLVANHGELPIAYADYFDGARGWEIGWGSEVRYPPPPKLPGR